MRQERPLDDFEWLRAKIILGFYAWFWLSQWVTKGREPPTPHLYRPSDASCGLLPLLR